MKHTQNDLSHDSTKLDYQALVRTAGIAFSHSRNEIERLLHKTYDLNSHINHSLTSERIFDEASKLVVAAETLHTLEGGLSRSQLEIVNKPECIKDDNAQDDSNE